MEKYFHVTTETAWEKIQKEGLIPMIGERSQEVGEPVPAIFLFDSKESMEDALWGWLGDELEDEDSIVILKVSLPKGYFLDEGVSCDFEVRGYKPIPPEYIEKAEDID